MFAYSVLFVLLLTTPCPTTVCEVTPSAINCFSLNLSSLQGQTEMPEACEVTCDPPCNAPVALERVGNTDILEPRLEIMDCTPTVTSRQAVRVHVACVRNRCHFSRMCELSCRPNPTLMPVNVEDGTSAPDLGERHEKGFQRWRINGDKICKEQFANSDFQMISKLSFNYGCHVGHENLCLITPHAISRHFPKHVMEAYRKFNDSICAFCSRMHLVKFMRSHGSYQVVVGSIEREIIIDTSFIAEKTDETVKSDRTCFDRKNFAALYIGRHQVGVFYSLFVEALPGPDLKVKTGPDNFPVFGICGISKKETLMKTWFYAQLSLIHENFTESGFTCITKSFMRSMNSTSQTITECFSRLNVPLRQLFCRCKFYYGEPTYFTVTFKEPITEKSEIQNTLDQLYDRTINRSFVTDTLFKVEEILDKQSVPDIPLLNKTLNILNALLPALMKDVSKSYQLGYKFLSLLARITTLLPSSQNGSILRTDHIALATISPLETYNVTFLIPWDKGVRKAEIYKQEFHDPVSVSLKIDTSKLERIKPRVNFSLLDNAELFTKIFEGKHGRDFQEGWVLSPVIAATAYLKAELGNYPIELSFQHNQSDADRLRCVFWNETKNSWHSDGCLQSDSTKTQFRCRCSHLTNFALLFTQRAQHNAVLEVLTVFSLIVSCVALIMTMIGNGLHLYISTRSGQAHNNQHKPSVRACCILLSLCFALLGGHTIFLATGHIEEDNATCVTAGILLHFFYLSVFSWSSIEGLNIFYSFIFVALSTNRFAVHISRFFLKASVCAWGIPAGIVLATAVTNNFKNYGLTSYQLNPKSRGICFLKPEFTFYIAFFAPYLICLSSNVLILIFLVVALNRYDCVALHCCRLDWKKRVLGFSGVCVVLNVTWILGALQKIEVNNVLMGLFVVLNGLQGFFIFVFYCLLKVEVRQHFFGRNLSNTSRRNSNTVSGAVVTWTKRFRVTTSVNVRSSSLSSDKK